MRIDDGIITGHMGIRTPPRAQQLNKLVAFTFLIGIAAACTSGAQQQGGAPAESQLAESTGCLQELGVTDDELTELRRVMLVTELVSMAQLDVPDHCLLASAVCTGGGLSDPALDSVWEKASFPESVSYTHLTLPTTSRV